MKAPILALCAMLGALAAPAIAQVSGSINRNVPTLSQGFHINNDAEDKIELTYKAIAFGEGQWQKLKDNKDMHERFNAGAERRPIGTVSSTMACKVAGKEVPAGEYKMFFTLHEQAGWILNVKNDDNHVMWRMAMTETDHNHTRLHISLTPGESANECHMMIAFGNQMVKVPVGPAAKKEG